MWMDVLFDGGFYKFGYTTVVKKKKGGKKVITELRKSGLCFTGGLETGRSVSSPSAVHDKLTHVSAARAMCRCCRCSESGEENVSRKT